jgi:hypothetical protein
MQGDTVTFADCQAMVEDLGVGLGATTITKTGGGHAIYPYNQALVTAAGRSLGLSRGPKEEPNDLAKVGGTQQQGGKDTRGGNPTRPPAQGIAQCLPDCLTDESSLLGLSFALTSFLSPS